MYRIARIKAKVREFGNHVERVIEYPFLPVKAESISCEFNRVTRVVFIYECLQAFGFGIES